jgi:hypothetical protein
VTFSGNMKGIDLLASDVDHDRKISIQVKTKTAGSWHANVARDGRYRKEDPLEDKFWIFVDLDPSALSTTSRPAWWVEHDIKEAMRRISSDTAVNESAVVTASITRSGPTA